MRIPDLDKILSAMLKTYAGISDLNFSVGHPLQVEDWGELKQVFVDPPIEALTPYQTEQIALSLLRQYFPATRSLLNRSAEASRRRADHRIARTAAHFFRDCSGKKRLNPRD